MVPPVIGRVTEGGHAARLLRVNRQESTMVPCLRQHCSQNTYSCMYEKIYNSNHSLTLFLVSFFHQKKTSVQGIPALAQVPCAAQPQPRKGHKEMTRFVASTWLSAIKIDGSPLIGR